MSELVKALRDAYEETDTVYFHLRTIINDAADTIDRLTAELEEYKSTELTANEYRESVGFVLRLNKAIKQATGKTALDWEELIAENARLTEQLGAAVGLIDEIRNDATADWDDIMFKIDKWRGEESE